jgi:putative restriction endonuclease
MANAVFTTQLEPFYDDLPEVRYHFPKRYLRQAEQTVGDWIIYYEPRRKSFLQSSALGRQCYYATTRVERIEPDPKKEDHFYAHISGYLEFTNPVPFHIDGKYLESRLQKEDGSTNRGRFGWSMRVIPGEEYRLICQLGFMEEDPFAGKESRGALAEAPIEYGRTSRTQLLERPFRDAAFTRVIQRTYRKTCAMTGLNLMNGGGRCETEAAHIMPVEQQGPDSPRNGIALCRTIHWMFDRGIVSISEQGDILMVPGLVLDQVRR